MVAAPHVDCKPAGGEAKFSGKPSCGTTRWLGNRSVIASLASNRLMRTPANTGGVRKVLHAVFGNAKLLKIA